MILNREIGEQKAQNNKLRIGLALSGGGFRASIFHLGVIRRLEELGIMQHVDVISSVSGGSIIAAYYVCEMENRLRELDPVKQHSSAERLKLFESIANDFLAGTDHNLRTRALIFTPFFHPIAFLKTVISRLFRSTARSELIQREYDRWFYDGNTLDELPSVTPDRVPANSTIVYGPKLILNTTSLLSGERVAFSREPVSKLNELSKVNKNVLKLSRVVGASSGVPVLFPPTSIAGDVLVDGGVSDNQGIEGLIGDGADCDVLIVSDASGQMEQLDTVSTSEASVFSRVNAILQFQVRAKIVDILLAWRHLVPDRRFAFVHLFLNLKDRPNVRYRIPSEFIPGVARIRTDLDQFSLIECETLMYHGYTLIDAQLRDNCPELLEEMSRTGPPLPLSVPPLFQDQKADAISNSAQTQCDPLMRRAVIRKDLEAGAEGLYILRSAKKYHRMWAVLVLGGATTIALLAFGLYLSPAPLYAVQDILRRTIYGLIPSLAQAPLESLLLKLGLTGLGPTIQGLAGILALLLLIALALYLVSFPTYALIRMYSVRMDQIQYQRITGADWSTSWSSLPAEAAKTAAGNL